MGHVRAWLSVNAVAIAIAVVVLLIVAALIRLWLHPAVLAVAVFTAILASVGALAIAGIGALGALRRVESAAKSTTTDLAEVKAST
ncbi:MAG TPA: hypothetical protein VIN40_02885, partial [Candidatus Tyrphobacter sp.]